jgi:hypothetical protein
MLLCSAQSDSADNINHVALAITKSSLDQYHMGIYYKKSPIDKTKFLHLAWDLRLNNDDPDDRYIWTPLLLGNLTLKTIAAMCVMIHQQNPPLHYGFSIESSKFNPDGAFASTNGYSGLTCSTFAIVLFASLGINFIDFDKWPIEKEDKTWQLKFLELLSRHISNKHIVYQKNLIENGIARFKPTDVVAVMTLKTPPLHSRDEAQQPAEEITNYLDKYLNIK